MIVIVQFEEGGYEYKLDFLRFAKQFGITEEQVKTVVLQEVARI